MFKALLVALGVLGLLGLWALFSVAISIYGPAGGIIAVVIAHYIVLVIAKGAK